MINLTKLPAAEAERLAYVEGYTGTAALFARIAELEGLLRRAVAWFDEYHASETEPAWVDEARDELGV